MPCYAAAYVITAYLTVEAASAQEAHNKLDSGLMDVRLQYDWENLVIADHPEVKLRQMEKAIVVLQSLPLRSLARTLPRSSV